MEKVFTEKEIKIAVYKVIDKFAEEEAKEQAQKQENPIRGLLEGIKNTAMRSEVGDKICEELGIDFDPREVEKEIG